MLYFSIIAQTTCRNSARRPLFLALFIYFCSHTSNKAMDDFNGIMASLTAEADEEKRQSLPRFFKTGKGEYAEGDMFLGVVVPKIRRVARQHRYATVETLQELLQSEYHEARMCALLIMADKCTTRDENTRRQMLELYLANTRHVNNWDLVDLSAPTIVGEYLIDKPRDLLYKLAKSHLLWENRIAIVATWALIRHGEFDDTYRLALQLACHHHDLIRKGTGWMLREAGKRDPKRLFAFIDSHRKELPRIMLRYAIEGFTKEERAYLMRK